MLQSKNRIMLLVSLLLVGGFLLTSLASYFTSRASLRDEIAESTLPLTSDNIYSEIQRDLLMPIFISSLMASDTFVRDWVIAGERDPESMIRYLNEIQIRYKTFTSFFVSEQTGIYYHASGILKKIQSEEPRDQWYYRVREMAPVYEINVDPDLANQDALTIFVNYKVLDYEGNYLGATGVGLTVYAVKEMVEEYQKRYQRNIYFVDRQGRITLHSSGIADEAKSLQDIPGLAPLTETVLASETANLKYRRGGQDILLNTRYIKEFDWYLLVEQSEGETFRKIFAALLGNLVVCALITAIVLLITNYTINAFQKRLEQTATTDRLTGIHNRNAFEILYPQILAECRRSGTPFSMILFDIDNFKQINDSYGHLAGDAVLKALTELTGKNMRASDMFFRWGGDEFLLLLKGCNEAHASQMTEKLRLAVETRPVNYEGKAIAVTVSLGIAEALPGESEDSLLRRGDDALYAAKRNGRNRIELAKAE
ncbi:sensor domain-containing diguanylate cyclase [Trichloromonas sp.]|uniref:sensor domain-containing diguanylate cyclase n=1 Tax=Trichloromonas sp. TaxID=3069249 RepID=UPI003D81300E